jgi:hypothetical protein
MNTAQNTRDTEDIVNASERKSKCGRPHKQHAKEALGYFHISAVLSEPSAKAGSLSLPFIEGGFILVEKPVESARNDNNAVLGIESCDMQTLTFYGELTAHGNEQHACLVKADYLAHTVDSNLPSILRLQAMRFSFAAIGGCPTVAHCIHNPASVSFGCYVMLHPMQE